MSDTLPARQWRCVICGYVHAGNEAPDCCPVCGTGPEDFEPYEATAPRPAATAPATRWQCLTCNYIHEGAVPPSVCPICGDTADRFQAVQDAPQAHTAASARVVIVGSGIAGVAAAEAVRSASAASEITLVSSEHELPYYRLNLTRYLAGEITRDLLPIHPGAWYSEQRIRLIQGLHVDRLDLEAKAVILANGTSLPFGLLILASGSHPHVPPLPGTHLEGVFSLRTTADAEGLLSRLHSGLPCVCIGGGVLGIETAAALAKRGAAVTLLESHDWLMPRQLNRAAAAHLERHLNSIGVTVVKAARTQSLDGEGRLASVRLHDGRVLPAELVVLATGVRPNTALARKAGLAVNTGVIVDSTLATSAPGVFAAGDTAEHNGQLYGTWAASQYQGTIAGLNALGSRTLFGGLPRSNTIKAVGLDLTSIGRFQPEDGGDLFIEEDTPEAYTAFVFRDNRMIGALLVGHADLAAPAKRAIESGTDFSLLLPSPDCADVVNRLRHQ
jgi:nitrite reductase (NADH) large subunit